MLGLLCYTDINFAENTFNKDRMLDTISYLRALILQLLNALLSRLHVLVIPVPEKDGGTQILQEDAADVTHARQVLRRHLDLLQEELPVVIAFNSKLKQSISISDGNVVTAIMSWRDMKKENTRYHLELLREANDLRLLEAGDADGSNLGAEGIVLSGVAHRPPRHVLVTHQRHGALEHHLDGRDGRAGAVRGEGRARS